MNNIIIVDWNNLKSIKKAEKQKVLLENNNFKCIKTSNIGFNKDMLVYEVV